MRPVYIHKWSFEEYKKNCAYNENKGDNNYALNKNIYKIIVRKNIYRKSLHDKISDGIVQQINRIAHSPNYSDPCVCKYFV